MIKARLSFILLIIFIAFSCNKDENELQYDAPIFYTEPVTDITPEGAKFSAKIVSLNDDEVIDHGFIWSREPEPNAENSLKVSLGSDLSNDIFTTTINSSIKVNNIFYVRAYIKTNVTTYFGSINSFKSLGESAPKIFKIVPDTASWGDTLTIIGDNFSFNLNENHIKFNDLKSELIDSKEDSLIRFIVPINLDTCISDISVTYMGNTSNPKTFSLTPPIITSFTPTEGVYDQPIEICGNYFKEGMTRVFIGDKQVELDKVSDSLIKTRIPSGLEMGEKELKVSVAWKDVIFNESFFNKTPIINDVYPDSITFGDEITIVGENFNPIIEHNNIFMNDIEVQPFSVSNDTLRFNFPIDSTISETLYKLKLEAGDVNFIHNQSIKLKQPSIIDFNPKSVSYGDTIVFNAKNLYPFAESNEIKLNEKEIEIIDFSTNSFKIVIPYEFQVKEDLYDIIIKSANITSTYSEKLVFKIPVITDYTPKSATFGEEITVYGNNFNPISNYNKLFISDYQLTNKFSSKDSIKFIIPNHIQSSNGLHPLTLKINNYNVDFNENIKIKAPVIDSISELNTVIGETIFVYGKYFNPSIQSNNRVLIENQNATIYQVNSNYLKIIVPEDINTAGNEIKVSVNQQETIYDQTLSLLSPSIDSISHTVTFREEVITVYGKNFSPDRNLNNIFLGENSVTNLYAARTNLNFIYGLMEEGTRDLKITVGSQECQLKDVLTLVEPYSEKEYFYNGFYGIYDGIGIEINGKGYSGVSSYINYANTYGHPYPELWEYDNINNTWSQKSNFPGSVSYHPITVNYNNDLYFMGNTVLWRYKPSNDTWDSITKFPESFNTRYAKTGFVINNEFFIIKYPNDLWKYNFINNTWSELNNPPDYSSNKCLIYNNNAFIIGATDKIWKYNIDSESWTVESEFPFDFLVKEPSVFIKDNDIYILADNKLYQYSINNKTWKVSRSFYPINDYFVIDYVNNFRIDDMFYFGGGLYYHNYFINFNLLNKFFEYDLSKEIFIDVNK